MKDLKMKFFRLPVLVLAVAVAAACGDSDGGEDSPTEPNGAGTFSATITGDVEGSISGSAVFGVVSDPQGGEAAWSVVLVSGAQGSSNVTIVHLGESPETRTYSLMDIVEDGSFDEGTAALLVLDASGQMFSGGSVSGTITITSVGGDRLRGTFSINAHGAIVDSGGAVTEVDVTVSGEFDAGSSTSIGFPGSGS
jgi:hypothetical protein